MEHRFLQFTREKRISKDEVLDLIVLLNMDQVVSILQKENGNGCLIYTTRNEDPIDVCETYEEIIEMLEQ